MWYMCGVDAKSPLDAIALAEDLNRSCHCIALDPARLQLALESSALTTGVYASILREQPNLFSSTPVFLARTQVEHIAAVVEAVESVVRSSSFRAWALDLAPEIARRDPGPRGVFLGYDFHLGRTGPQLIEINTNAGGGLLNAALAGAQQACCSEVEAVVGMSADPRRLPAQFLEMFRAEWALQRGALPLRSVAIVDEAPESQYLYPEFRLFQELFRGAGALWSDGERIDLVYNRLTDFTFSEPESSALRAAYEAGEVVVTPHPHAWALYADKRHLTVLSDPDRLRGWGIPEETIALLAASVPRTVLVEPARREELWRDRRRYFFKPVAGYGGKAAYRGDKLTRSAWETILDRPYVAQHLVPPSERTIRIDEREVPLKLDVRAYVYDRRVQLAAARLYQGQTTNFRTAGGGFAPVFTEALVHL